jgi:hypothetical protein
MSADRRHRARGPVEFVVSIPDPHARCVQPEMAPSVWGWHVLPNGGAAFGDRETGNVTIYSHDGQKVCAWSPDAVTDADRAEAKRVWDEIGDRLA